MQESKRIAAVSPPVIPLINELIRQTSGTISLGQGVVFYPPPPEAYARLEEIKQDSQLNKYQPVTGLPALINQIQSKLYIENKIEVTPEQRIVITAGSNMAFVNVILAICDPGAEVILPAPYYFNHEMAIRMANCVPVLVPTDDNYQLQLQLVAQAITDKTRAIVTVSPNNPTGAVYSAEALCEINNLCQQKGLYHISDEAYEYFTYDDTSTFSVGAIPTSKEHTISLFSLSKAYGLASWRIGWMLIPNHLAGAINKIQDTILICPPVGSQLVALGAMQAGREYCLPYIDQLAATRSIVLNSLSQLGSRCDVPVPQGAFYCYLKLDTPLDSFKIAERLIRDFKVATIPGTAFGSDIGCYLRISYGALQPETVKEGIQRLTNGIQTILRETQ